MGQTKLKVTGQAEVDAAFDKLSKSLDDMTDAHTEQAQRLLPGIKQRTRKLTGTLAGSWNAAGDPKAARFTNPMDYAPTQEYGSAVRDISPTQAVRGAFEDTPDGSEQPYSAAIERRAERANLRVK